MSCSIQVREYWAQAPPQEMSPRLKSVPTSRSSRRSSWCSDTTSDRWIVGLVALAILARTWVVTRVFIGANKLLNSRSQLTIEETYLADKEQEVSVTGEVHGEEEEGQLLHHTDATFMG